MITSASNQRLKLVRKLQRRRARRELGLFVCEGEDLVTAALAAGLHPVDVLVDASRPPEAPIEGDEVEPRLIAEISELGHPARVIATFRTADLPRVEAGREPAAGLALWHVGDPGNVGTLVRTAHALGPAAVYLSAGCADPTGGKALRASAGAIFRVALGRFDDAPRPRIALVPAGGTRLADLALADGTTFMLGSERDGLPPGLVASCEAEATIPLAPGAESLNVATAGAIALYEWRRREMASRPPGETG